MQVVNIPYAGKMSHPLPLRLANGTSQRSMDTQAPALFTPAKGHVAHNTARVWKLRCHSERELIKLGHCLSSLKCPPMNLPELELQVGFRNFVATSRVPRPLTEKEVTIGK